MKDTIAQYHPGQAGIFIGDWEAQLGLPKCGQTEQDTQTRLAQILAMFRISPYSNAEFFVDIAAVFGYDITVVLDGLDPFKIEIQVDGVEDIFFRVGVSSVGEKLEDTQAQAVLECILNFFKHSHTHLVFT